MTVHRNRLQIITITRPSCILPAEMRPSPVIQPKNWMAFTLCDKRMKEMSKAFIEEVGTPG
jgi:hypothetical protein